MLRRNLLFAPKSVKAKAYISTVRPIIETASICWSPSADKYKKMIEGVQHSAAQFVANYYPKKGKYEEYSISKLKRHCIKSAELSCAANPVALERVHKAGANFGNK